jgi:CheY-like chemotaxis protein
MKILLVEDSRATAMVTTARLESFGHEVQHAISGQLALECFQKSTFDLILMDIEMPGMNGFETTTRIRALEGHEPWAWTPIIFVTATDTATNVVTAIEAGGDDFISKMAPESVLQAKMKAMSRIAAAPSCFAATWPSPGSGCVVYGSLHPFAGWRDTGVSPSAFLEGGWPRYWTALRPGRQRRGLPAARLLPDPGPEPAAGRFTALVLATLLAGGISFRAGNRADLAAVARAVQPRSRLQHAGRPARRAVGAGGRAAHLCPHRRLEHKLIAPVPHAELGLTLLGLWLLVPLSPETLLFGAGDLRQMLGLTGAVPFAAESFVMIEASITAFNVLAVGLIVRCCAPGCHGLSHHRSSCCSACRAHPGHRHPGQPADAWPG